ncbi:MAG: HAMP domain-containing histidine kinase [Coriobacteriia bacterium]|nr:HAMP domain-containing histidine kinase [Coriobacteriia bacterium]
MLQRTGRTHRASLRLRYVSLVVAFVVSTGLLLGAAVTLVSLRQAAQERQRSLEYAASAIAASTIPSIADEERDVITARMTSLVEAAHVHDIECISVRDTQGNVIAQTEGEGSCDEVAGNAGLVDVFTKPQRVVVPIEVDDFVVGSVHVQFRPVGLEQALYEPLGVTALVLAITMVLAALWGGWMVLRTVVEPIGSLKNAASRIARGERALVLADNRRDEIGELATALDDMTRQLGLKEQELLDSYGSLEVAFIEKSELAQRLERNMSRKSDFVAVASHELRSPLAVIQLYSEMLENNEFGDLDPELAGAIDSIVLAVSRLSSIVRGLLDVALLERGLIPLEYAEVPLHDIVEEAVYDASNLASRVDVSVVTKGDVPTHWLRGDRVRLRQALDNLISNAVKYSKRQGVVSVAMRETETEVIVEVVDRGSGVDPEHADALFEPFARGDVQDNSEIPGLGLGLPIADRIVRAHGGAIGFQRNPEGVGSVFTIRLPLAGASEGLAAAAVRIV